MPREPKAGKRPTSGRGTKPARKAARRAEAQQRRGASSAEPPRPDQASGGAWQRRQGPRRLGPSTVDAPGRGTAPPTKPMKNNVPGRGKGLAGGGKGRGGKGPGGKGSGGKGSGGKGSGGKGSR